MKKITLTVIAATLGTVLFALPALAATTASLTPATLKTAQGQQFNVVVAVNPQGFSNDVEKIEVDYPASLLQVSSFTLGNTWMALTQPGYDLTDNTNGVLIKTAGYPGGVSTPTTFGTIVFTAKKAGSGTITIGNQSIAFETNSQSAITGNGTAFTVTAKTVTQTNAPVTPAVQTQTAVQEATNTAPVAVQPAPNTQVAAVVTTSSASYVWVWILLIVVVLIIIGYWLYSRKSEPKA